MIAQQSKVVIDENLQSCQDLSLFYITVCYVFLMLLKQIYSIKSLILVIKSYTVVLIKNTVKTMFPIIHQNAFVSNKEKIESMLTEQKEWLKDGHYRENVVKRFFSVSYWRAFNYYVRT